MRPCRDSLNCRPSVFFFLAPLSVDSPGSSPYCRIVAMNLSLDDLTQSITSSEMASRFLSRKPVTLYGTAPA